MALRKRALIIDKEAWRDIMKLIYGRVLRMKKIYTSVIMFILVVFMLTACRQEVVDDIYTTTEDMLEIKEAQETNNIPKIEEPQDLTDRIPEGEDPKLWEFEIGSSGEVSSVETRYEAEDAQLIGLDVTTKMNDIELIKEAYSGTGFVGIWDNTDAVSSRLSFAVTVEKAGRYELEFLSASPFGEKYNHVIVNEVLINDALVTQRGESFLPSRVYADLKKGVNLVEITESWGWIYVDALNVREAESFDTSIYQVKKELINEKANDTTKRLMSYLVDQYGRQIISGQYQYSGGMISNEFKAVYEGTGRYPAIMGLDFIDYSPSRVERGSKSFSTEDAIAWDKAGGIVTFAWHWNAPKDLVNSTTTPWWKGFYTEGTTFDFAKAINGEDEEGYTLLLRDIDAIAIELKRLEEADVPVLWRPLHEASGGWFWWGAQGAEYYKKLWILLYERLTVKHQLNNLIWVWNGQGKAWYPGDQYVDMIGEDIYASKRDYGSQRSRFEAALAYTESNKMIALTENGVIPEPSQLFEERIVWASFATWNGEFTVLNDQPQLSSEYTELEQWVKVYNHPKVITLDELPNLKTYPLE